jgi:hypothetical protein
MDNVQKNTITDYNAPSPEPFRLHLNSFMSVQLLAMEMNLETIGKDIRERQTQTMET